MRLSAAMSTFTRRRISDERYESAAFADVNGNGIIDIISGPWWYEGPEYTIKHKIWDPPSHGDYYDDFSTITLDVSGDGYPDIITGGWFGKTLWLLHNPGAQAAIGRQKLSLHLDQSKPPAHGTLMATAQLKLFRMYPVAP